MEADVKFHEKVHLPKNQRHRLNSSPSESKRHRGEITHHSVENKDSSFKVAEVARKNHGSTTILPNRAQFNTEPPRQDVHSRAGVQANHFR